MNIDIDMKLNNLNKLENDLHKLKDFFIFDTFEEIFDVIKQFVNKYYNNYEIIVREGIIAIVTSFTKNIKTTIIVNYYITNNGKILLNYIF